MFVIRHPKRYLINMSHREMAALRKVVDAGILLLEGEAEDGLWASFTTGQKITLGKWKGNPLSRVTGPKQERAKPLTRPLSSVT